MTGRHRRHQPADVDDADEGSFSVLLAVIAPALMLIVGLVIDLGGGEVNAVGHADFAAREAARAAAQAIQPTAVTGTAPVINEYAATLAANNYLTAAGLTGSVTFPNNSTVHVTVIGHFQPLMLGMIGVSDLTVHGHGQANLEAP